MNRSYLLLAVVVAALAHVHASDAGVTERWDVDSYSDWNEGEGESVLITSDGEIRPGWATDRVALEFDSTWSAARAADGSLLLGSDDEGAIYRVAGGKATKLVSIDGALAIVALAVGTDGMVYAGTMPGGQVWSVDVGGGKASKLVALEDVETVWSLAIGAGDGQLYAGTGPDGKLFRIDPKSGKSKMVFDTEDKRVLSLAATSDGAVWLGTSDKAMVFRYDPKSGTARAMADFDGNEVTALAAHEGGVIAAANKFKEETTTGAKTADDAAKGTKKEKRKEKGEKGTKPKDGEVPGAEPAPPTNAVVPRKGARKGTGALFRIEGDGRLEQLHALTSAYYASVAAHGDRIFAGDGDKGRIYVIAADDSVSTAFDVKERVVAHIVADDTGVAFATADGAALYTARGAAGKAAYLSDVLDAKTSARYGKLVWHGSGDVKVDTRTGNTSEPGIGWSKWQPVAKPVRRGGESWGGGIVSPPGRYLQFRVTFNGDADAAVRAAAVYHLPANRPTKIEGIEVKPSAGKGLATMAKGAAKPRSPVIKISWKVENLDKDATAYTLAVRREGEVMWRPLPIEDGPLTKTEYEWNTETFPDGFYHLRVTAVDGQANTSGRELQTHKTTPLFVVDNNKPELSGLTVRAGKVSVRAVDTMTPIAEASFSIDDGPWMLVPSDDGLFDDLSELLVFGVPDDLAPGPHTLAIRVADEAGNVGSASVTFRK